MIGGTPPSAIVRNRWAQLAVLFVGILIASRFGPDWARAIGYVSGHSEAGSIAIGALLGCAAMICPFAVLAPLGARARLASSAGLVLFGWLLATQPYSRTTTNTALAHLYDRVAPGYVWGLIVSMGVTLVIGSAGTVAWVVRYRRAQSLSSSEAPGPTDSGSAPYL